jgi:hypothetical protein
MPIEKMTDKRFRAHLVSMNKTSVMQSLFLVLALSLFTGCGGSSASNPAPLNSGNLNLIFVTSGDLAYHAPGDINPGTANLTNQGLQRSLLMATFLQKQVLGTQNVTGIYALEPMTHLQTGNDYPDMASLETIQQFAMLNQISLSDGVNPPITANSYPIFASYSAESVPAGVAPPVYPCEACQGLDFSDQNGDNETLMTGIVTANVPGFYVFSAPWETISSLLTHINSRESYSLTLPSGYKGPNSIYAISVTPSGKASLVTYKDDLNPPATYPALPPLASTPCTAQTPFRIQVSSGAVTPAQINTNETIYFIRHTEAHPITSWEDGNYIAAGQWRALALPKALSGKIQPTQVISIDPANGIPAGAGRPASSYVRAALTVEPYAIANNLPYSLADSVAVFAQNAPKLSSAASDYLFTGGKFSNQTVLAAWEHEHIPTTVNALLASYQSSQIAPNWPDDDYDTIWTVKLDAQGNLTVDNSMCEGINSAALPAAAPRF